jgi:hypothetical protein
MVAYKWYIVNTDSQRASALCSTAYWLVDSWNEVWLMWSVVQYCINYFDNHYLTALLGNNGYAFQIHIFWEFAMVFDGEYCTFLRVHNLYSNETSYKVVKKTTRCLWLIAHIPRVFARVGRHTDTDGALRIIFDLDIEQRRIDRRTLVSSLLQVGALTITAEVQSIVRAF